MKYPVRIGIVGGGQLGKMLAVAAKKLGFLVYVIDPTPQSPAGQVADKQIVADFKDADAIRKLSTYCDVMTFEIELANDEVLKEVVRKGVPVHPSPLTLSIIQDKLKQKQFLKKERIQTANFVSVDTKDDIARAARRFGYPVMLKARTDAYDGRGNAVIASSADIEKGLKKLKGRSLYVEEWIPFIKELAVMVARNTRGDIAIYPVAQTIHTQNICDVVISPAPISKTAYKKATFLAKKVVRRLRGAGVFGIEMFLKKDHTVLVNEIAPRVHNSGHYTIEASITSQFEQHIRAICGLPLGATNMIPKAVVMKNILGTKNGPGYPAGIEKALDVNNVSIHIYGKHDSFPQRKMGHITVVGDSIDECLRKANQARRVLVI